MIFVRHLLFVRQIKKPPSLEALQIGGSCAIRTRDQLIKSLFHLLNKTLCFQTVNILQLSNKSTTPIDVSCCIKTTLEIMLDTFHELFNQYKWTILNE